MFTRLFASLRGLARRRRIDGEISEELQDHLEREVQRHRARGVPPDEARRLALRDLGGLTQTTNRSAMFARPGSTRSGATCDTGRGCLRRSPRFTVTALTVLVLGIGSTTAIFSIAYAVLVRPLPYADADRLVFLAEQRASGIAWPNFDDWRSAPRSFDGLASSLADAVIVTGGQLPRRLDSRSVTVDFFGVLGVTPFRAASSTNPMRGPDAAPDCRREPRIRDAGVRQRAGRDRPDDLAPHALHGDRRAASGLSLHDAGGRVPAARAAGGGELSRDAEPRQPHESLCRRPAQAGSQT